MTILPVNNLGYIVLFDNCSKQSLSQQYMRSSSKSHYLMSSQSSCHVMLRPLTCKNKSNKKKRKLKECSSLSSNECYTDAEFHTSTEDINRKSKNSKSFSEINNVSSSIVTETIKGLSEIQNLRNKMLFSKQTKQNKIVSNGKNERSVDIKKTPIKTNKNFSMYSKFPLQTKSYNTIGSENSTSKKINKTNQISQASKYKNFCQTSKNKKNPQISKLENCSAKNIKKMDKIENKNVSYISYNTIGSENSTSKKRKITKKISQASKYKNFLQASNNKKNSQTSKKKKCSSEYIKNMAKIDNNNVSHISSSQRKKLIQSKKFDRSPSMITGSILVKRFLQQRKQTNQNKKKMKDKKKKDNKSLFYVKTLLQKNVNCKDNGVRDKTKQNKELKEKKVKNHTTNFDHRFGKPSIFDNSTQQPYESLKNTKFFDLLKLYSPPPHLQNLIKHSPKKSYSSPYFHQQHLTQTFKKHETSEPFSSQLSNSIDSKQKLRKTLNPKVLYLDSQKSFGEPYKTELSENIEKKPKQLNLKSFKKRSNHKKKIKEKKKDVKNENEEISEELELKKCCTSQKETNNHFYKEMKNEIKKRKKEKSEKKLLLKKLKELQEMFEQIIKNTHKDFQGFKTNEDSHNKEDFQKKDLQKKFSNSKSRIKNIPCNYNDTKRIFNQLDKNAHYEDSSANQSFYASKDKRVEGSIDLEDLLFDPTIPSQCYLSILKDFEKHSKSNILSNDYNMMFKKFNDSPEPADLQSSTTKICSDTIASECSIRKHLKSFPLPHISTPCFKTAFRTTPLKKTFTNTSPLLQTLPNTTQSVQTFTTYDSKERSFEENYKQKILKEWIGQVVDQLIPSNDKLSKPSSCKNECVGTQSYSLTSPSISY